MFGFIGSTIGSVVKGAVGLVKNVFTIGAGVAVGVGIVNILRNRLGTNTSTSYSESREIASREQRDHSDSDEDNRLKLIQMIINNQDLTRHFIRVEEQKRAREEREEQLELQKKAEENEEKLISRLRGQTGKIMTIDHLVEVKTANRNFFGICASDSVNFFCDGQPMLLHAETIRCLARGPLRKKNYIWTFDGAQYVADEGRPITLDFWTSHGIKQSLAIQDNLELITGLDTPTSNAFVADLRTFVKESKGELVDKIGTENVRDFIELCERVLDTSPSAPKPEKLKNDPIFSKRKANHSTRPVGEKSLAKRFREGVEESRETFRKQVKELGRNNSAPAAVEPSPVEKVEVVAVKSLDRSLCLNPIPLPKIKTPPAEKKKNFQELVDEFMSCEDEGRFLDVRRELLIKLFQYHPAKEAWAKIIEFDGRRQASRDCIPSTPSNSQNSSTKKGGIFKKLVDEFMSCEDEGRFLDVRKKLLVELLGIYSTKGAQTKMNELYDRRQASRGRVPAPLAQ